MKYNLTQGSSRRVQAGRFIKQEMKILALTIKTIDGMGFFKPSPIPAGNRLVAARITLGGSVGPSSVGLSDTFLWDTEFYTACLAATSTPMFRSPLVNDASMWTFYHVLSGAEMKEDWQASIFKSADLTGYMLKNTKGISQELCRDGAVFFGSLTDAVLMATLNGKHAESTDDASWMAVEDADSSWMVVSLSIPPASVKNNKDSGICF